MDRLTRIAERDGWTCWICGADLDPEAPPGLPMSPTIDHVVPRSRGGSGDDENLRLAHRRCNGRRGNRAEELDWPVEFHVIDGTPLWVALSRLVKQRRKRPGGSDVSEIVALVPSAAQAEAAGAWATTAARDFVGGSWAHAVESTGAGAGPSAVRLIATGDVAPRDPGRALARSRRRRNRR